MDIESYRKSLGLSQEGLASEVGVEAKSYISRIESGAGPCSLRVALKLEIHSRGLVSAASIVSPDDRELLEAFLAVVRLGRPLASETT